MVKGLEETCIDLNNLLKKFENMDSNTKRFSLSAYRKSMMKKRNKPSWTYF